MASGHRWNTVGDAFLRLLMAEYREGGKVHWPTVISASACLAGETALMTNETRIPEAGAVDSQRVSDFIHDGDVKTRTIWGYSEAIATQAFGIEADTLPSYRNVVLQLGMRLETGSFPALDVPLHLVPRETPMNAGPRLRKQIHEIARDEGAQGGDSAFALATAMMKMIGSAQHLGIRDLTSLALQCCVAGSRFAPLIEVVPNQTIGRIAPEPFAADGGQHAGGDGEPQMPAAAAVAAALSNGTGGFGKRR